MSELAESRAELRELELHQNTQMETLDAKRAQFEALAKQIQSLDLAITDRRKKLTVARVQTERAEERQAALERGTEVTTRQQEWIDYYESLTAEASWAGSPLPYQKPGAMFLATAHRAILGDEPGLGKTFMSIMACDYVEAKRIVVVVIAEVASEFEGEFSLWAPERKTYNLTKQTKVKRHEILDELAGLDEFVVIVNYEILRELKGREREVLDELIWLQCDTLIVDEAHNMKNAKSANAKRIETLAYAINTCARCGAYQYDSAEPCDECEWHEGQPTNRAYDSPIDMMLSTVSIKNVWMLTGTPILNEPGDLYPLLHLADPLHFKTLNQFYSNYCANNIYSGKWEFRDGGLNALKPMLRSIFLARTAEEVGLEIPKQRIHIEPIDMDASNYPGQAKVIEQLTEAAQIVLEDGRDMTVFETMTLVLRKRQANVWPAGIEVRDRETEEVIFSVGDEVQESIKLDKIADKIVSLLPRRQVVFSQFKGGNVALSRALELRGVSTVLYDGDTPEELRQEIKSNFKRANGEAPRWDVVLANYRTGGVGLNLTAATVTHIFDEEWNPGKRDQGYKRTARLGQEEETDVYVWRIKRSIDTWMANLITYKENIIAGFNDAAKPASAMQLRDALESGEIL